MKKFTFLLLTILPVFGFSQSGVVITNNTFDSDISTWSSNGSGASVVHKADDGNTANGSLQLNAANASSRAQSATVQLSITADTYELTLFVKGTNGTNFHGQVFQSGAGKVGAPLLLDGTWQSYTISDISLTAGVNTNVRLWCDDASGGTFYFDDAYVNLLTPSGNFLLTVDTNGGGTVTKTPEAPYYPSASSVNLVATANTHWLFDSWSGDISGGASTSVTMDADKTGTANFVVDPSFDYNFQFSTDGDLEGWSTDPQVSVASHAGGLVTLALTANQFSRFNLYDFPIPTGTYNKVNVTLKNETTSTDQITPIVIKGGTTETLTPVTMTTSDGNFVTYGLQLSNATVWTGNADSIRIRFADADNPNQGRPSESGNIVIDNIAFVFDPALGVNDFETTSFSIYPNPANDVLNINGKNGISKVALYSITGKKILETTTINSNQLDVSKFTSGIYLISIEDSNNNKTVKKVIIK
ncbi:T9SS type A sorting domain-containing protein [Mariniflexile sp. HNIBRBA6329]|uniref:T9SS type A sorting domain-containing protein n=1 Tax=Mariniflexile sp. HNIBRBA6329 TaxID=3373088 RepID=UPI00374566F7